MTEPRHDLAGIVLGILFLCGLILASLWILLPFLGPLIWAAMIAVSTWPLLIWLERHMWGRRALAVTALTLVLVATIFVPLLLAVAAIVANVDSIVAGAHSLSQFEVPPPPDWAARLPLVGPDVAEVWQRFVGQGLRELAASAAPYAGQVAKWIVAHLGGVGALLLQFLLTIVITAVLWTHGEAAAARLGAIARRVAGERGEQSVRLAGQSIRGVAFGVVGTALVQSFLAGIGLLLAGVPFAPVLTAVSFLLCIAQLGPFLVLLPAVGWLYASGSPGWGTFLLVWTLFVGTIDNFVRPILIRKGVDLPLLLVFAGVLGGLMTLGLIGVFVGPVVLAVTNTLLDAWARQEDGAARGG